MRSILLLIALPFLASAQVAAPTPPRASLRPGDKCRIEGTVVNSISSEPLQKAQLVLHSTTDQNGTPYGATTDASGHYVIENIDPGKYRLLAARNGFVPQNHGARNNPWEGTMLSLTSGQKLKDIDFKLTPQGVVVGRVIDEDGEPVANVNILCSRFGYVQGKRQLMPTGMHQTNDLGEYRVFGLAPGRYFVSANYNENRNIGRAPAAPGQQEEGYPPIYYPNANSPAGAAAVDVAPGEVVHGIDITLIRTRAVRIRGSVVSATTGKPVRYVGVMMNPRDQVAFSMPNFSHVRDDKGSFEFRGVVPGVYTLRVNVEEEGNRESAKLTVEVGNSNIEGLQVTLAPTAEIKGTLKVEDNADTKGSVVGVGLRTKQIDFTGGGSDTEVKDDRTFVLQGLTPESYSLNVWGLPETFYLKSVRSADTDFTESGLDFTQGVTTTELNVVVSPHGGQIDGSVQNEKQEPGVGVSVVLVPETTRRGRLDLFKKVTTDQNGHFTIKGVAPGEYKLFAWEDVEEGAYEDPDFLKSFENAGESVTIQENSHESKQLTLIPAVGRVEKQR